MAKRKSQESNGSSSRIPYERTLRKNPRVSYSDAEILELADPGRAVSQPVQIGAAEGAPTQPAHTASVPSTFNNVPKGPTTTWAVEGEFLDYMTTPYLNARFTFLLTSCTHRATLFNAAIQRFDMYLQFFNSACNAAHPDGTADVVVTLRAVTKIASELFAPRHDYTVAITMLRHFVAGLLQRLKIMSEFRMEKTKIFNELSRGYEEVEYEIRDTVYDVAKNAQVGAEARGNLGTYMEAFKQRGKMLGSQKSNLEELARECLEKLAEGDVEV